MGRADADIIINDKDIARWHCALEIKNDVIRLRDLESTNGTFFEDERVRVAELKHLSEFRIGGSVILLSRTPKLAVARRRRAREPGGPNSPLAPCQSPKRGLPRKSRILFRRAPLLGSGPTSR